MSPHNGTALAATQTSDVDDDLRAGRSLVDQAVVRIAVHADHQLVAEHLRRALAPSSDRAVVMHSTRAEETELVLALGMQDLVALLTSLEHAPAHRRPTPTALLSPREEEAVALVAGGLTNHEVAARMFVTDNTLRSYLRSAYRKMGVRSRTQAVGWALSRGLA